MNINEVEIIGKIVSSKEEKEYTNKYIIKVISINNDKKFKNTELILYTDSKQEYKYGDILNIEGEYEKASSQRNYRGFDYRGYLKQKGIFGIIYSDSAQKIDSEKTIFSILNNFNEKLSLTLDKMYSEEESSILKAMLLGNNNGIEDNMQEVFQNSNLAHVIAISGQHINYIELVLRKILDVFINSKRKKDIIIILFLIIFCIFSGGSPSCIRSCFMICFSIIAQMIYRNSNKVNNICFALLFILIYNPYYIGDIGLQLSFGGIIGLNLFKKIIKIESENKIIKYIIENLNTSLAVQIIILPIVICNFNKLSLTFFISNILVSFSISPILILGYFSILIQFLNIGFINFFIINIEKIFVLIFLLVAKIISEISISKIMIATPNVLAIFFYYFLVIMFVFYKHKLKNKVNKIIIILLIFLVILTNLNFKFDNNLEINFIDVGQGDSCLITSPQNKKILIDAGEGGVANEYDYGKSVVLPYLLDKKITSIDYIMISHFDSDHAGGTIEILENTKVKNIIISKQYEESSLLKKVFELCYKKDINVILVKAGDIIKIDKYLNLRILWPDEENVISENQINNNSIVARLEYFDFKMLFTGDIEQIAEEVIINKYLNSNFLESEILKVAHHGSKTSSTIEFLEKVKPKIALIGVGEDNSFGHPNLEVLERIKNIGAKIYRTDVNGEISIVVNKKGRVKLKKFIK